MVKKGLSLTRQPLLGLFTTKRLQVILFTASSISAFTAAAFLTVIFTAIAFTTGLDRFAWPRDAWIWFARLWPWFAGLLARSARALFRILIDKQRHTVRIIHTYAELPLTGLNDGYIYRIVSRVEIPIPA